MAAKEKTFYEIGRDALADMIDDLEANRPLTAREVQLPEPPALLTAEEIARIRAEQFGVSQEVFARLLNVAVKTVQAWEQGRNVPTGATLRLIRLAQKDPGILLGGVRISRRRPGHRQSQPHFSSGGKRKAKTTPASRKKGART